MKRLLLFVTILGLIFLLSLAGYKLYKHHTKETITVVALESERSILHIPVYIALKENFFNEYNIKVNFKGATPEDFIRTMKENPPDILLGETVHCLFDRPCSTRSNWFGIASVTCHSGYFLLAREDIPAFQWEDIKGETIIAGPPENSGELILESIARDRGMRPQYDFTVLWNIPKNLKASTFAAGTGSYVLLKEPEVAIEESKNRAFVVSSLGEGKSNLPEILLLARKDFADKNPQAMQGFTDSIYKAQIWLQYHNAGEIAQKTKGYFPKLNQEVLKKAISRYLRQGTWSATPKMDESSYEKLQEITKQCGELYCTMEYREQIDNRFAERSVSTVEYIPRDKQEKKYPQDFFRVLFE